MSRRVRYYPKRGTQSNWFSLVKKKPQDAPFQSFKQRETGDFVQSRVGQAILCPPLLPTHASGFATTARTEQRDVNCVPQTSESAVSRVSKPASRGIF